MDPSVVVVLATYNGAPYVEEQIESLRAQDLAGWRLLVRDDGSTDGTRERVEALARRDARIQLLEGGGRLGVVGNFGALLRRARDDGAQYVFPCDQDDVWVPGKMSRLLAEMARLEAAHGRGAPLLVHSDLRVVDEALSPLRASFLRHQGIAHEEREPLRVLLVQNFVTGCASLLNRPLLDFALPLPPECIVHDWWLAQCAAASGRIGFLPEATVLYRQHGWNQIGAGGRWGGLNPFRVAGRKQLARSWRVGLRSLEQARALHERMVERGGCAAEAVNLAGAYAEVAGQPVWRRLRTLRRLGIRRQRLLGTALLYVRVAMLGIGARP